MFGLQPTHVLIIVVVALLIFGPSKLPEIGKALGKTIREFQTGIKEATQGFVQGVQTSGEVKTPSTEIKTTCKGCGKSIPTGIKFCPECGAAQT